MLRNMIPDSPGAGSRVSGDRHRRPPPRCSTTAVSRAPPASSASTSSQSDGRPRRRQRGQPGDRGRRVRGAAETPRGRPHRPQTSRPERLRSAFTAQLPHSGQTITLPPLHHQPVQAAPRRPERRPVGPAPGIGHRAQSPDQGIRVTRASAGIHGDDGTRTGADRSILANHLGRGGHRPTDPKVLLYYRGPRLSVDADRSMPPGPTGRWRRQRHQRGTAGRALGVGRGGSRVSQSRR